MGKTQGIRPEERDNKGQHQVGRTPWSQHLLDQRDARFFHLLKSLAKGTPDNRKKAAAEVARNAHLADSPQAREIISQRLEAERMAFVRAQLIRTIIAMTKSGIDCKEFLPQIKLLLKEGTQLEKMECANALRHIGDRASVPPLAAELESGDALYPPTKHAIEKAIDSLSGGDGPERTDSPAAQG